MKNLGRLLFFWFPVLLLLRDESHFVIDVVEAIDYRIGRGGYVGYDAGNGLVVAGVHDVGSWPSFVMSDFEVAWVSGFFRLVTPYVRNKVLPACT